MDIPQIVHLASRRRQTGLSLVELMIALVVGLVLMAGVLSAFISSRQSYGINNASAQTQENGRFALDFLTHDVRMGGYMGCLRNSNLFNDLNTTNTTFTNFSDPVDGYQSSNINNSGGALSVTINTVPPVTPPPGGATYVVGTGAAPALDTSVTNYALAGSDVIVLHSVSTQPIYVTNVTGNTTADIFLNSNTNIAAGQLGIVTNCVSGVLFQVTGPVASSTGSGNLVVNTGASTSPGNNQKISALPGVAPGSQFYAPNTMIYYIGAGTDGSPGLFRLDAVNGTAPAGASREELVPNVENMQILYGVDTTGAQVPTQYLTADQVSNWNQVVSVRIGLLVQSDLGAVPLPAAAPSYNVLGTQVTVPQDTRLRRVFTTTIGLRNQLP